MKEILDRFQKKTKPEEIYQEIIAFGGNLKPLETSDLKDEDRVQGCQSLLFLKGELIDGKVFFRGWSEALISKGLCAILTTAFSGLTPEEILISKPDFLHELRIPNSLTPGRAGGLSEILVKIKQIALKFIL